MRGEPLQRARRVRAHFNRSALLQLQLLPGVGWPYVRHTDAGACARGSKGHLVGRCIGRLEQF